MEKIKTDGLKDVAQEVIGWENNKVFLTLKHLTTNPSEVVSEFCQAEKSKYLSPVVYYLGVESVKSYLSSVSGLSDYVLKTKVEEMKSKMSTLSDLKGQIDNHALNDFFVFVSSEIGKKIVMLPLLLLFTWLFYRKRNGSFKENSWFALYSAGHASLLSLPVMLLLWYTIGYSPIIPWIVTAMAIFYWAWVSTGFYHIKFARAIILRGLMVASIYFIMVVATFMIAYLG